MHPTNIRLFALLFMAASLSISQTVRANSSGNSTVAVRNHRITLQPSGQKESILVIDPINNQESKISTLLYIPTFVDGKAIAPESSPSQRSRTLSKELMSILAKNANLKQLPDGTVIVKLHYLVTTSNNDLIYADPGHCYFKSKQGGPLRILSSESIISTEVLETVLKKIPAPTTKGYSLITLSPSQLELRVHQGNISPVQK